MSRFEMMYQRPRVGLDNVIEADTYKVNGKFFDFVIDKEVVRSLLSDAVLQIRRMADDEDDGGAGDDSSEDDLSGGCRP